MLTFISIVIGRMMTSVGFYELTTEFTTAGGGQCRWAFAERAGREFFIKEFLRPTYPLPDGPGSEAIKSRKRRDCEAFESRQLSVMRKLKNMSSAGGNLIVAADFFRQGSKFYKVTEKIEVSSLRATSVKDLGRRNALVLASAVAHSVQMLHRVKLVHGDLKPDNILLKETKRGHTTKLIDFDDCYSDGDPPDAGDLIGDITYYSPEVQQYLLGDASARALTSASDIFSLGIIFGLYFSGTRPTAADDHTTTGSSCADILLRGGTLQTGLESVDVSLSRLVLSMVAKERRDRPSIARVISLLKECLLETAIPLPESGRPRLKGSLRPAHTDRVDLNRAATGDLTSRLRGSLARREKRD